MRGSNELSKRREKKYQLLAPAIAATSLLAGFGVHSACGSIIDLQYLSTWGAQSSSQTGFTTVNIGGTGPANPLTDTFPITAPGVSSADSITVTADSSTGTLLPRNRTGYESSTYGALYDSIMFANGSGTTLNLSVSGLITGDSYQLVLYGADAATSGTETFTDASNSSNHTSESWGTASPTSLTQYAGTLTLTANGSGAISVNITDSADSGQAMLNGFSLSLAPTPEPASLGFLVIAGGLLVTRRRHTRPGKTC